MQASEYNYLIKNKKIIFNSFSGALAEIKPEEYEEVCKILKNPNFLSNRNNGELFKSMVYGGFLTPHQHLDILKYKYYEARYSDPETLSLTLMPTNNCNCKCVYCYESINTKNMTNEIQDSLIRFVEWYITENTVKNINICWFGGEPLLAIDNMKQITQRVKKICDDKQIKYTSFVITNATLLTYDICKSLLEDLYIETAQVTLDGLLDTHDKKRVFKNGKGTFETICANMVNISKIANFSISIRVNYDKDVVKEWSSLLDYLEDIGLRKENVSIYTSQLRDTENYQVCNSNSEVSEDHYFLLNELIKREWNVAFYPSPKAHVCMADIKKGSYVVDAEGYLYNCWHVAGIKSEAIGSIIKQNDKFLLSEENEMHNYFEWMISDVFDDKECVQCPLLPVCMGGCPHERIKMKSKSCSVYKNNVNETMSLLCDFIKEKKSKSSKMNEQ